MRFYHRLDVQLAALFVLIFVSMITVTGLLDTVNTQIWIKPPNPTFAPQLAKVAPEFKSLEDLEQLSKLRIEAQSIMQRLSGQGFVYVIANQQFRILANSGAPYTFIELVRAEAPPAKDLYTVVTSSSFDKNEFFVTFTHVPALPLPNKSRESLMLLVVEDPTGYRVSTDKDKLIGNLKTHIKVFGWYYLLAAIAIVLLMRNRLKPLRRLEDAANQLTHNRLPEPVESSSRTDEVGQLVNAFNTALVRLNNNEQMRNQMIADIAHELRTPLTNISGRIEAWQDDIITDAPALIEFTSEQIKGLINIVEDMNLLNSLDSNSLKLQLAQQPLVPVLTSIMQNAAVGGQFSWHLECDKPHEQQTILLDTLRFGQVINNLLDNAQKAKPDGLEISLKVLADGDNLTILFEDNGPGVTPEQLPRLFDRLYRADDSRNLATGGSGLGLSIVKNLIEAHHGTIDCYLVKDTGLGFAIHLPRS